MSQFPSSRRRSRRGGDVAALTPGVTESLAAPGVSPIPGTPSRGASMADQMLQAVGLAGNLVQDLAARREREQLRQARAQALIDDKRKADEAVQRSKGALDATTSLADWEAGIAKRDPRFVVPDGVSFAEFSRDFINAQTEGFEAPYADGFRAATQARLASLLQDQSERDQARSLADNLDVLGRSAPLVFDESTARSMIDGARELAPNLTESQLYSSIAGRGILGAAKRGDADAVALWEKVIDGRLPETVADARNALADVAQRRSTQRTIDFQQRADDAIAAYREGAIGYEDLVERVQSLRTPELDPRTYLDRLASVQSLGSAAARAREIEAEHRRIDALGDQGLLGLVAGSGDGGKAAAQEGLQRRFEEIELQSRRFNFQTQQYVSDPTKTLGAKVDESARQGLMSQQWLSLMQTGSAMLSQRSIGKDGQIAIPPVAAEAFGTFLAIRQRWPQGAASIPEKNRAVFEAAASLMETPLIDASKPGAAERALAMAVRARENPVSLRIPDTDRALLESSITLEVKNKPEIVAETLAQADLLVRHGVPVSDATAMALKQVESGRITINGWSVPMGEAVLPQQIRPHFMAEVNARLGAWHAKHGADSGVALADLTLIPDPRTGSWIISDRYGAALIGEGTVWSTQSLLESAYARESLRVQGVKDTILKPAPRPVLNVPELPPRPVGANPGQ